MRLDLALDRHKTVAVAKAPRKHQINMCCLHFTLFFRRAIEIDEEEDDKNVHSVPSQELNAAIADLSACLENLRTCNDLISKHGRALQSTLVELESGDDLVNKTKLINERATIFRISSNAMINVSAVAIFTPTLTHTHRQIE